MTSLSSHSPDSQWATHSPQEEFAASAPLRQYDLLTLMARLCDTCAAMQMESLKRGELCDITNLFELALKEGSASKEDTMKLWEYFTLASLAAKQQYTALPDEG